LNAVLKKTLHRPDTFGKCFTKNKDRTSNNSQD